MRDLALLHQWSVSTCYGFGDDFLDDVMPWRDHLPVLAQQFPFLMRGMLALSALHLAKNATNAHTRVKFLRTAAYHQDLALPEYRGMLLDVTRENAVPVLAFSAMLAIYSFAAPKTRNTCSQRVLPNGSSCTEESETYQRTGGVGSTTVYWNDRCTDEDCRQ